MANFSLDASKDNYCVMGNPVAHSKSPKIHTAFAAQTNQAIHYQSILVEENGFPEALEQFQRMGGKGINITVPFKQEAWQVTRTFITDRADLAQAVNTIWFDAEKNYHGDNTDGIGLIRDLTINHKISLTGMNILIAGAGGAVRGIVGPLCDEQPSKIVIANRTLSKAENLANIFSDRCEIAASNFEDLVDEKFDVIINGTSTSLQNKVPPIPEHLIKGSFCYDLMYSNSDTTFISWAKKHKAADAIDGLGMLVEQAAESFYIWRGLKPDTVPVIDMLREQGSGVRG